MKLCICTIFFIIATCNAIDVYVDVNYIGGGSTGSAAMPFTTFADAIFALDLDQDNKILISPGTYFGLLNTNLLHNGDGTLELLGIGGSNPEIDLGPTPGNRFIEFDANTAGPSLIFRRLTFRNADLDGVGTSFQGGVVAVFSASGEEGHLEISDCEFYDNTAERGGVILWDGDDAETGSTLTLINVFAQGNQADNNNGDGGFMVAYQSRLFINVTDSEFRDGYALDDGGFFDVTLYSRSFYITRSKFINGIANGDRGGAINQRDGGLYVFDSIFEDCSTGVDGGAYYSERDQVEINDSSFTRCTAGRDGGALAGAYGDWDMVRSTFTDCRAVSGNGGAISTWMAEGDWEDSTFTNCTAAIGGGAAYLYGAIETDNDWFRVNFVNNTATYGGGLYAKGYNFQTFNTINFTGNAVSDLTYVGTEDNYFEVCGPLVVPTCPGGPLEICRSEPQTIRVAAGGSDTPTCGEVGTECLTIDHAMTLSRYPGATISLTDGIFTGFTVPGSLPLFSSGIIIQGTGVDSTTIQCDGSCGWLTGGYTIEFRDLTIANGRVFNQYALSSLTVRDAALLGWAATNDQIHVDQESRFTETYFYNVEVANSAIFDATGGCSMQITGLLVMEDCFYHDIVCEPDSTNDGLFNLVGGAGDVTFLNTVAQNIQVGDDGAWIDGEEFDALRIEGCTFDNLQARDTGGVINVDIVGSRVDILDNTFTNNVMANNPSNVGEGGVIHIRKGDLYAGYRAPVRIRGNTMTGNGGPFVTNGGAIFVQLSGNVHITENIIRGNTAIGAGGGLYIEDSFVLIENNVISENEADDFANVKCVNSVGCFPCEACSGTSALLKECPNDWAVLEGDECVCTEDSIFDPTDNECKEEITTLAPFNPAVLFSLLGGATLCACASMYVLLFSSSSGPNATGGNKKEEAFLASNWASGGNSTGDSAGKVSFGRSTRGSSFGRSTRGSSFGRSRSASAQAQISNSSDPADQASLLEEKRKYEALAKSHEAELLKAKRENEVLYSILSKQGEGGPAANSGEDDTSLGQTLGSNGSGPGANGSTGRKKPPPRRGHQRQGSDHTVNGGSGAGGNDFGGSAGRSNSAGRRGRAGSAGRPRGNSRGKARRTPTRTRKKSASAAPKTTPISTFATKGTMGGPTSVPDM